MSTIKTENTTIATTSTSSTTFGGGVISTPSLNSAFQLPINMSSNNYTSAASVTATTTITTTRNNISVTNIKCEVDDITNGSIAPLPVIPTSTGCIAAVGGGMASGVGIRIPLTKTEDSDSESEEELTNIENLKVHRRATSTLGTGNDCRDPTSCADGAVCGDDGSNSRHTASNYNRNGPRPMSWEGELSENETTETELMETENSLSNGIPSAMGAVGVAVIKREATTTIPSAGHNHQHLHHQDRLPHIHPVKPELEQVSVEIHNNAAGIYSSHHTKLKLGPTQSDPINLKYEPDANVNSPLLARNKTANLPLPANPSPDSAIHSVYTHSSPSQSPLTSRHAPYTPSLSRNNSDASHSSCYSYSSEFSPTHSPIQSRHAPPPPATPLYGNFNGSLHHSVLYRPVSVESNSGSGVHNTTIEAQNLSMETQMSPLNVGGEGLASSAAGISRQQLINSPCPICGDKISGFHYGIFSCESCKGFFKRTVQNRKNYVCVRGGPCPVSISTRKKCPACRFEKCLQKGMKLEAIREDRTRGGRSTYQCSYTLPNPMLSPLLSVDQAMAVAGAISNQGQQQGMSPRTSSHVNVHGLNGLVAGSMHTIKTEQAEGSSWLGNSLNEGTSNGRALATYSGKIRDKNIPQLLQEIMDVEHLWQYNDAELARLNQPLASTSSSSTENNNTNTSSTSSHATATTTSLTSATATNQMTNPLLASAGLSSSGENANPDLIAHLCNVADHRLYKIVKWCKSLPLFKNISIDDQICLLINSWCELLLFSCCYRSIDTPGEIKMSQGKKITLAVAKTNGLQACIERMLNLTDHLRRLRVDRYEYVAMKVIVLLQSDTSELQEPVKVRECQEKALQSLQTYTLAHYPDTPSKFGELLLRIPDLQRTCQLGKEMLTIKSRDGGDFNLLMELLRGEH